VRRDSGAKGPTYRLTSADYNLSVRLRVEATNPIGTAAADSAVTARVAPAAPVAIAIPVITGTREDGATLTADNGTWKGTTPIATTIAWERYDALLDAWNPIAGATARTLPALERRPRAGAAGPRDRHQPGREPGRRGEQGDLRRGPRPAGARRAPGHHRHSA
jgi:hypothetical protein